MEASKQLNGHSLYISWLDEKNVVEIVEKHDSHKAPNKRMEKILKENQIIKDSNKILNKENILLKNTVEEKGVSFKLVRERSAGPNIIETKRTVLTKVDINTTKKQVSLNSLLKLLQETESDQSGYSLPEKYECRKCVNEDSNKKDTLDEESSNICQQIQYLDVKVTRLTMQIEKLEENDSKCGKRQRQLKESLKLLKINPALRYFEC